MHITMSALFQTCFKSINAVQSIFGNLLALSASKYHYVATSRFRFHVTDFNNISILQFSASSRFPSLKECRETGGQTRKAKPENIKHKFARTDRGSLHSLPVFVAGSAKKRAEINADTESTLGSTQNVSRTETIKIPIRPLSPQEWKELKEESNNSSRFELRMMERMLSSKGDISVAKSLLAFVALESGTIGYELLLKYLALCVHQNHSAEIVDVYDIMKITFKTLETGAYSLLIKGFSRTERWAECLSFLDSIKKVITPSPRNYGDAIFGALTHKEAETAWKLYEEMMKSNLMPNLETLQALFDSGKCFIDGNYKSRLMNTLLFLRDNQVYPDESLMLSIKSWFESIPGQQWKGHLTTVEHGSQCPICSTYLESIQLSEEEYQELKSRVMNDVIQGTDVFKKTTPQELADFQKFVHRCPPFDVVVDGLNVANVSSKVSQSQTLLDVVSHLAQQGLRLLVLGRKHMLKGTRGWERRHVAALQEKADCFFTENVSEDDPFLLYATLHSGNHCKFLSRDLMRDHKACLPDSSTRRLFFKWQRGHQLVLSNYLPGKRIKLQAIPDVDTIIQTTGNTWHIPYDEHGVERYSYEVPRRWLCLQRIDQKKL